jgi:hypothetical protein
LCAGSVQNPGLRPAPPPAGAGGLPQPGNLHVTGRATAALGWSVMRRLLVSVSLTILLHQFDLVNMRCNEINLM